MAAIHRANATRSAVARTKGLAMGAQIPDPPLSVSVDKNAANRPAAEDSRVELMGRLDRLSRQARKTRPPAGIPDGEAYRMWLYERVRGLAATDRTDADREATRRWLARIANSSTDALWREYMKLRSERD